jgi:hypothetical protein
MLWLLQCLDGESSSGQSPVPQIRWIGQFLLSRLFSSLTSSVLRSGFSWVPSLVWCLLHFWSMTSCTYNMPRSACSVALETYHGASTIILRILDWLLWIIDMLDLLAKPHNSRPYVQIGMYRILTCHNVAKYSEFYLGQVRSNVTSTADAGCFKKSFTMVLQMLLCGECYEKVYT